MKNFGEKISSYLRIVYGEQILSRYEEFINSSPSQYLRVNPLKTNPARLQNLLRNDYRIFTENIPGINALKVKEESLHDGKEPGLIGKIIEHIIGLYYIQGLSSMLPAVVLNPSPSDKIVDLCSAPGSKTTQLGELMMNRGILISNEVQMSRVKALVYNLERMNIINTGVLHSKGELLSRIYNNYFDKILLDAPCSALGIIRKNSEVGNWWSEERVAGLGELQFKLLVSAVRMLKAGGEMVYSTCTLTIEENELLIDKLLGKYPVRAAEIDLPVHSHEGVTYYKNRKLDDSLSYARRIFPWDTDSDGFFVIKLIKTSETESKEPAALKPKQIKFLYPDNKDLKDPLRRTADYFGIEEEVFRDYKFFIRNNDLYFINEDWEDDNPGIFEKIGTRFGVIDRKGEIILHTQAAQILDKYVKKNIFVIEENEDLKRYLEGGTIKKNYGEAAQCLVKYKDYILGSGVNTPAGIKSRFPRAKRTQFIYTGY